MISPERVQAGGRISSFLVHATATARPPWPVRLCPEIRILAFAARAARLGNLNLAFPARGPLRPLRHAAATPCFCIASWCGFGFLTIRPRIRGHTMFDARGAVLLPFLPTR
jgi:hypothetical protein